MGSLHICIESSILNSVAFYKWKIVVLSPGFEPGSSLMKSGNTNPKLIDTLKFASGQYIIYYLILLFLIYKNRKSKNELLNNICI